MQQLIKPILLRRTKKTKDLHGESIVELPKKTIIIHEVEMNELEKEIYEIIESRC